MQVSQTNETVTHAIIGAQEGRSFKISDDPVFFQMLSSNLYTNQPLAVVRETLCNAWDAHIEAGKTDVPVKVWFDKDNNLHIRDYGSGIPDELMESVYGVFGGSTKRSNKNVTGGLGLGCKAPFAITDQFEVTSWNQGTKTIYNIGKSSGAAEGKPGIFPIMNMPTEESGLEVCIPIDKIDIPQFRRLIKQVAYRGEILVDFEGTILPMLPFSKAEHGVLISRHEHLPEARIFIRYGNVIYPAPDHDDLRAVYDQANVLLRSINRKDRYGHYEGVIWRIIFQAPANSLTVTPSREALSTTDQTIGTINKIIPDALESLCKSEEAAGRETRKEWRKYLSQVKTSVLLSGKTLNNAHVGANPPKVGLTTRDLAALRAYKLYGDMRGNSLGFEEFPAVSRELQKRPGFSASFLHQARKILIRVKPGQRSTFLPRSLAVAFHYDLHQNLLPKLREANLTTANLALYTGSSRYNLAFRSIWNVKSLQLWNYLRLSRKIVVLGYSQSDVEDRLTGFLDREVTGPDEDVLFYRVPRSFKGLNKAREAITSAGYKLLDMTIAQPWEEPDVIVPYKAPDAAPKLEGLPTLAAISSDTGGTIWVPENPATDKEIKERTTEPKYVVVLGRNKTLHRLPYMTEEATKAINQLFGKDIGVCVSETQANAYIKKGAKSLRPFLFEWLLEHYKKNRRIRAHLKRDHTRVKVNRDRLTELLTIAEQIPELQTTLKVSRTLTEEDWKIIHIGRAIREKLRPYPNDFEQIQKVFNKLPLDAKFLEVIKGVDNWDLPELICPYQVLEQLHNPDQRQRVISVLKAFFKG